jgi:hypothetical protein
VDELKSVQLMIDILYSELNYSNRVSNPQGTEGPINKMCLNNISDLIIPNNVQSNLGESKKDHSDFEAAWIEENRMSYIESSFIQRCNKQF